MCLLRLVPLDQGRIMRTIPTTSGIYFVRLLGTEPVSVNDQDASRRESCIMVNSSNCKFGRSTNLARRHRDYCRTFTAARVMFDPLLITDQPGSVESRLKAHFRGHRMIGTSGRHHEWLAGIDPDEAYAQALNICLTIDASATHDANSETEASTVLRTEEFEPQSIVNALTYLDRRGITSTELSELHHFKSQTVQQSVRYFSKTRKIRSRTNQLYAARLGLVESEVRQGGTISGAIALAVKRVPIED